MNRVQRDIAGGFARTFGSALGMFLIIQGAIHNWPAALISGAVLLLASMISVGMVVGEALKNRKAPKVCSNPRCDLCFERPLLTLIQGGRQ